MKKRQALSLSLFLVQAVQIKSGKLYIIANAIV